MNSIIFNAAMTAVGLLILLVAYRRSAKDVKEVVREVGKFLAVVAVAVATAFAAGNLAVTALIGPT